MQILVAILVLAFLIMYVIPNIFRYPWHTLVFVAVGAGLLLAMGGGERLMARLKASKHPAARRYLAAHAAFQALLNGAPPYDERRWWIVRTLVQGVFWIVMLAAGFALIVAMGGIFHWIDNR